MAITFRLAAAGLILLAGSASAQQQPSANASALAKEIITAKGAANLYDPVIPGVIERAKGNFIRINPMLLKDLNEVAAKLRAENNGRAA